MMIENKLKDNGWILNSHNEWVSPDGHLFADKVDAYTYEQLLRKQISCLEELATLRAALQSQSAEIAQLKAVLRQIAMNAPQDNVDSLNPTEWAFWRAGQLAKAAITPQDSTEKDGE
jgi:ribosomal protein L29